MKSTLPAGLRLFKKKQDELLDEISLFESAFTALRYEGKPFWGGNVKRAQKECRVIEKKISAHFMLEEKVLFPFLKTHIPRTEPQLCFLEAEHREPRFQLQGFSRTLRKIPFRMERGKTARLIHYLAENGTYMLCLLKNYFMAETRVLGPDLFRLLRPDERSFIGGRMRAMIQKGASSREHEKK